MTAVATGRKILIVDDEPDLVATCVRLLRRAGYEPLVALNGREAMEFVDAEHPDLVLTDLRLPGADGLAVLRHARRGVRKIPVILFTAFASEASRSQALQEGAAAYLPKPFSLAELRAAVEQALAESAQPPNGHGV
ncbi:MAG: response regulator [Candidatus Rokubacteria bacterium]|nr:response regulator [Candidatus Rokubacteria bacterium]